jgi:hypothetical protein
LFAKDLLLGEKNGKSVGMKFFIVVKNAGEINRNLIIKL